MYRLTSLQNARHRPTRETMRRLMVWVYLTSKWNYWTNNNKKLWLVFGLEWKSLGLWPLPYLLTILDFRVRVFRFCLLVLLLFRFIDDSIVRNILVSIIIVLVFLFGLVYNCIIRRSNSCLLLVLLLRRWLPKPVGSVCWWRSCISITTIDFSMNTIFNIILPMSKGKSSDYNKD